MTNQDLINLIVPQLITVLGWIITILWAIKQISIINKTNLGLQQKLMIEEHKRGLAKEIINIYKDIAQSIHHFQSFGTMFIANLLIVNDANLKNTLSKEFSEKITLNTDSEKLITSIDQSYNDLSKNIFMLEMWLKISKNYIANADTLEKAIVHFKEYFTLVDNREHNHWLSFQTQKVVSKIVFQAQNEPSKLESAIEQLDKSWNKVNEALEELLTLTSKGTIEINQSLSQMETIT